ncbi:hypothetical protein [Stakelama tenebrarum]|uniref:ACT domain-containing protein n=1 Tax=Stakelama tenebrarum TaxID=2711215 RepID=A0A6G6Y379_9SPHN|nr:hypothetical protein [Sphingosinithalassobacter tenebrarum]QIG79382.1 hypothetical protein G5C33_05975 [Sphingosinithalassobacter tenebrarum]
MSNAVTLRVEAEGSAGLLCRLIGLLAQRDLDIPALEVRSWREGVSEITIMIEGADADAIDIIAARMQRFIGVLTVRKEGL